MVHWSMSDCTLSHVGNQNIYSIQQNNIYAYDVSCLTFKMPGCRAIHDLIT